MTAYSISAIQICTDSGYKVSLLDPCLILRHEEHDAEYAVRLGRQVLQDGFLIRPLVVERKSRVLLDGHHRLEFARNLGFARVPCVELDYDDPRIRLGSWRENINVTRELVLTHGLEGRLMPKKTSRHIFTPDLGEIRIPIELLQNDHIAVLSNKRYGRA